MENFKFQNIQNIQNNLIELTRQISDLKKAILEHFTDKKQTSANWITEEQAMDILKVKRTTLYILRKKGKLVSRKIGRSVLISKESIERLMND